MEDNKKKPGASISLAEDKNMAQAGLNHPTKFLLGKRAIVPEKSSFVQSKLGTIPEPQKLYLKAHLNNEMELDSMSARRFGRKKQKPWTPSSEHIKEFQNA
ncbi:hypothetical protein [Magnetovibrio blakemorei]|uniref:hypothetical protein n=1 Tax=Magnetovibrio blakemorei TaxID=28181 RepID=UPI00147FB46A|nr:hypothetical protein [Magnetovibrio blakemorei]